MTTEPKQELDLELLGQARGFKRELSNHAATAKAIRQELKQAYPGTLFKVRAEGYSGGSSVNISWIDGVSREQVEKITSKYQYGHFDVMIDLYEYSNKRKDIPQVKYVMENRSFSDEFTKRAAIVIATEENLPLHEDLSRSFQFNGDWLNMYQLVWRYCQRLDLTGKTTIRPIRNYSGNVWDCYEAI